MVTTSVLPSDFVDELTDPGLEVDGGLRVPIKQYLCSNPAYGGAASAGHLYQQLLGICRRRGVDLRSRCNNDPFVGRVFTGQARPSSLQAIMNLMIEFQEDLSTIQVARSNPRFPRTYGWYFEQSNPFIPMVEDKLFGFDCIGFVSRYLVRVGLFTDYRQWPPLAYLNTFRPIARAEQAQRMSVLVWENGSHIAIIDDVQSITTGRQADITATICQSSSSEEARGPQTNERVILRGTGRTGSYTMFGETGSGQIFRILARGTPRAPVGGDVYIGTARNLSFERERDREPLLMMLA